MEDTQYHVLVVDDEPYVRQLAMRALTHRGFRCEPAGNGARALEMAQSTDYDVVLTDLQMPRQHGHSLAVELLALPSPPIVVVLTGLADPRLAKDLLLRGVDDIVFKPIDFDFLALKIERLLKRRQDASTPRAKHQDDAADVDGTAATPAPGNRISREEIEAKLSHVYKVLPMSHAAFDVFNMTRSEEFETDQIAAAIARDASLSVELLKLANSGFYNVSGTKITDLEEVVVRIGRRRIGDLALATSALTALTPNVLPWLAINTMWRQSIAAGVAADVLVSQGAYEGIDDNLFLSAVLHPLGRIVLGTLYAQEYQQMIKECQQSGRALLEMEKLTFAITHGQVLDLLLKSWSIPAAVSEPLRHASHGYGSVAALPEPLRSRTEALKLAVLIGRTAVGQWQPWECIEFPPEPLMRRLSQDAMATVVKQTRADSSAIISFSPHRRGQNGGGQPSALLQSPLRELAYCNLSPELYDFLPAILATMGIRLMPCSSDEMAMHTKVLISSIWALPSRLTSAPGFPYEDQSRVIIADAHHLETYGRLGTVVVAPTSCGALQSACRRLTERQPSPAVV